MTEPTDDTGAGSRLPLTAFVENPEIQPHLEGLRRGRLVLPVCCRCAATVWYPRAYCPACGHDEVAWQERDGSGHVYSFSVVRRAPATLADATPYVVAYVELDDGPRILTNLVDADPATLAIGDRVLPSIVADESHPMLRFRPAPGAEPHKEE